MIEWGLNYEEIRWFALSHFDQIHSLLLLQLTPLCFPGGEAAVDLRPVHPVGNAAVRRQHGVTGGLRVRRTHRDHRAALHHVRQVARDEEACHHRRGRPRVAHRDIRRLLPISTRPMDLESVYRV